MTDKTIEMIIKEYALSDVPSQYVSSDEEPMTQRECAAAFGDQAVERSFATAWAGAQQRVGESLPRVHQVLPGLARGDLGLIAGGDGVGKTTLSLALAMNVAAGRDLFRLGANLYKQSVARKVVFLGLDESSDDYTRRVNTLLERAVYVEQPRPWLNRNLLVQTLPKGDASLMRIAETLSSLPAAGHNPDLIVLDSLSRINPGIDVENGKELGAAIHALAVVGQNIGASIILTQGMKASALKLNTKQHATAAMGSTALPDQCSWQLNLAPAAGPVVGLVRVHNTKSCQDRFRAMTVQMRAGGVTRYVPPLPRDSLGRFVPDRV
ncbi:hypothetical protein GCM10011452_38690 [Gemmobacter lanyuensis]|uniref:AAA+ ATPase domain-containing protein n=1 Tax=Gemmobacter lanyuensis TaxID=1054497 RepID=A0A918J4G7_9RHOB|nr:AAA family ATPase [Gemmobacter lanyuensis]GGW47662.1 hypothetical protein GCM10011452_38690 [Gemmobacter lanyuensis]